MDALPPHKVTRCRDCPAQIIWTRTKANGRAMPVDAEPVHGGNVVLTTGTDTTPSAEVLTRDEVVKREARGVRSFVSHFVTCPAAAARRKHR